MKAIADFHHTDLYRSFQFLFEKRLGWELYRPSGRDWYPRFYWHPIEAEAIGNLTPHNEFVPDIHGHVWNTPSDGVLFRNYGQDGTLFRWLPLDRIREIDLIICTTDRNEQRFHDLKREFGLKCPILRYTGNADEPVNPELFDIFIPAVLSHYKDWVQSGRKPGILYHPEFDIGLYSFTALPVLGKPIVRSFLNFNYHHREPGSPWETWNRYEGYGNEIGALSLMHGLGTPPPGLETELDVIIDICFRKMGREDLLDRSKWPDLKFNRGEPPNHKVISELMKFTNLAVHIKRSPPEGYGFVIHNLAACGRPMVVEEDAYRHLSAYSFLQHRETCLFVNGHDPIDKSNYRWALEPENNRRMSETLHRRFHENVNFDDEAYRIKQLL
jgi:hypothetical protein